MRENWQEEIMSAAQATEDGKRTVPWKRCREAALKAGIAPRVAEAWACGEGICPSRYERSVGTLGLEGQRKLLSSSAAVVGCGGLGGLIVDLLARAGVGRLVLVDDDSFSDNNLNRQILSTERTIGRKKVEIARERVSAVNGSIEVLCFAERLAEGNAERILSGCDVAVDALDNNSSRRTLRSACRELGIPMVHGAIGGFWGQAAVLFPEDQAPWETAGDMDKGVETSLGNPPSTPALIASIETAEAVRLLAGVGKPLRDLLWCDLVLHEYFKINLSDTKREGSD